MVGGAASLDASRPKACETLPHAFIHISTLSPDGSLELGVS